jgi:indolepyruvate ferredoxin oxidoreductase alpha subunit
MEHLFLLGDEAIAIAAVDSGISGAYSYPGTPATEIMEFIQKFNSDNKRAIRADWSSNEKTALEEALGMSFMGKRAMVSMKHVGLNVAADVLMNCAITGVNGGLVLVVADDPSMHSSQNEQDSRFYGKFSFIPVFEPTDQQESYNMTLEAFKISEEFELPVMIRITTRLAHSRGKIVRVADFSYNELTPPSNTRRFILLPSNARLQYLNLLEKQGAINKYSERSKFNTVLHGASNKTGFITCGLAYQYLIENLGNRNDLFCGILKIGFYPFPSEMIIEFCARYNEIYVLEEGYPLVEELLNSPIHPNNKIKGRLNGHIPRTGELNPGIVAELLGKKPNVPFKKPELVIDRHPSLCQGCGHAEIFEELKEALQYFNKAYVFSDIGCYTLGALAPFSIINSCVDMGASITMAKGASDAGLNPSIAVIGDSTFTHSGMTGLLDAINENSTITVIICDNNTSAMTGGQDSAGTGKIDKICLGLGLDPDHMIVVDPSRKNRNKFVEIFYREFSYKGTSVILARRECVQKRVRINREKRNTNPKSYAL